MAIAGFTPRIPLLANSLQFREIPEMKALVLQPTAEFVETREIPEMKALVLQPTAEFVETYLLSLRIFMVFDIRNFHMYLRYSIYAVRKLFGHMAGVSDRYFPPTFYNEPLAS